MSLDLMFFRGALLLLVIARDVLGNEDVDDFQSEHRAELLLGHARLNELQLRHRSVMVLVHLVKRCLDKDLLAGLICIRFVDQQKKILDYLLKLLSQKRDVQSKYHKIPLTFNVIVPSLLMSKTRNICLRFSSGDPLDMI